MKKSVLFVGSVIIVMVVVVMTSNMRKVAKKDEANRYINNGNGTITDTKTGLMWASKDNGSKINWLDARSYCQNFKGGGYTDWRMPTLKELSRLYDENRPRYHRTTPMITLSNQYIWAGKTQGSTAAPFTFIYGRRGFVNQNFSDGGRALPVRDPTELRVGPGQGN